MGIEYHSQPEWLTKTVEISNLAFSIIFAVEMILKLAALGFFQYIADGFNVFDGVIVILRYVIFNRFFDREFRLKVLISHKLRFMHSSLSNISSELFHPKVFF